MLTREQKDKLEGLVQLPQVNSVYIRTTKIRNDVSIHLEDSSDRTPIEEAVSQIVAVIKSNRREPLDRPGANYLLYNTEIKAKEANIDIYVSEDKEEAANVS